MKKILVLDDNLDILQLVEDVLIYENFEVLGLSNANGFLQNALQFKPDLCLIDYRLTGADCGELCTILRSHPELEGTPIIIFSAYLSQNLDLKSIDCDDFIAKPFDISELIEKINNLLYRHLV